MTAPATPSVWTRLGGSLYDLWRWLTRPDCLTRGVRDMVFGAHKMGRSGILSIWDTKYHPCILLHQGRQKEIVRPYGASRKGNHPLFTPHRGIRRNGFRIMTSKEDQPYAHRHVEHGVLGALQGACSSLAVASRGAATRHRFPSGVCTANLGLRPRHSAISRVPFRTTNDSAGAQLSSRGFHRLPPSSPKWRLGSKASSGQTSSAPLRGSRVGALPLARPSFPALRPC
jgi:hypothetical protein